LQTADALPGWTTLPPIPKLAKAASKRPNKSKL
jgi:hypothetical protein